MASLTDAYDRQVGNGGARGGGRASGSGGRRSGEREEADGSTRGRPYLGATLLAVASGLVAGAVVLATSITAAAAAGLTPIEANEVARVLAGVGLPLTFVGVLAVVPTTRRLNALASIGFVLAVCGVGAFFWAYPDRWLGDPLDLTLAVAALYAVGFALTFLALVAGVLAFGRETREGNDVEPQARDRSGRTSL